MVITDEKTFRDVEKEGFRRYSRALRPEFIIPSRVTISRDCLALFEAEKQKLKRVIKTQRVCLTTDTWSSNQNLNYMCLTAHWIDNEWILHKRILNLCTIANHKGETIGQAIEGCLKGWGIHKIFTITVDNASTNDSAIKYIVRRSKNTGGTVLKHEFLHLRCSAHILNLILQEGMKELDDSVIKIRNAVRYVRSSPARLLIFKRCIEMEEIKFKGLVGLDVETRWNSTYVMLRAAEQFEKAFARMTDEDSKYLGYFNGEGKKKNKLLGPPMDDDFDKARCLLKFLELFYMVTLKFSSTLSVTSNLFFHELIALQDEMVHLSSSDDAMLRDMSIRMMSKFMKYWVNVENLNPFLYVAVVLDPRYKLRYVKYCFEDLYNEAHAKQLTNNVEKVLNRLYDQYLVDSESSGKEKGVVSEGGSDSTTSFVGAEKDPAKLRQLRFARAMEEKDSSGGKSECAKYLAEPCEKLKDEFDILLWWKVNSSIYPILAQVARDVLAVPVSTVASESTFSTSGRIVDPSRTSLAPRMVEALVCTQNWLRSKPLINDSEAVPLDALSDPNEDQANGNVLIFLSYFLTLTTFHFEVANHFPFLPDFLDSSPFILTEDDGLIIDA
ncbi:unnamed protein product [Linum tenue]|uniref:Transposase n=1 Tax=Linum tenue TaxID=586396 RepID=A0AAV0KGW1_9ROSI|nr:unnamed protein product [Linum tenue]